MFPKVAAVYDVKNPKIRNALGAKVLGELLQDDDFNFFPLNTDLTEYYYLGYQN